MLGNFQLPFLPDIVFDAKIETQLFGTYTQHIRYEPGSSVFERQRRKQEQWVRERFLGQGAYGTVYLERCDDGDDRKKLRAVKEIRKNLVAGKELEYIRELEAAIKFSHQKYRDYFVYSDGWFESDDSVYISMEYLREGDLQRHLIKPIPESEARQIAGQLLKGLKYMHENGFVHRDLKPGNIMVVTKGPDWFVKIADFGISKRRRPGVASFHTVIGTMDFMAPEVLGLGRYRSKSYSFPVDMWSLGAVIYRMLTNTIPFTLSDDLLQYISGAPCFPYQNLQDRSITEQGQQFIAALMSPDPGLRLSSTEAEKHSWMIEPLLLSTAANIDTGDTLMSEASAAWSSNSDQREDATIKQIEAKPTKILITHPKYRAPYIEECIDESEGRSEDHLPVDYPYVLDSRDAPLLPPRPPSPSTPVGMIPTLRLDIDDEQRPKSSSSPQRRPDEGDEDRLSPNPYTRPKSPYAAHINEKTDIYGLESPSAEFNLAESPTATLVNDPPEDLGDPMETEDYQDEDLSGYDTNEKPGPTHASMLPFDETRNHREALSNELDLARIKYWEQKVCEKGIREMACAYCQDKHAVFNSRIEVVYCGHWICHSCLVERFALALVSKDYKLQCCGTNIDLSLFRRILVDPAVNELWTTGYVREDNKPGPDDEFVMFLNNRSVFFDPWIASEVGFISGIEMHSKHIVQHKKKKSRSSSSSKVKRITSPYSPIPADPWVLNEKMQISEE
ncbi:hypothetical protein M426DRAFT_325683 [Hypoxylon sp. CI-4A]|nr:hypothetical protein M426DRAFT_325683 [Hypoxylon sp. CI-4A]